VLQESGGGIALHIASNRRIFSIAHPISPSRNRLTLLPLITVNSLTGTLMQRLLAWHARRRQHHR
jgi:hypothetical protein